MCFYSFHVISLCVSTAWMSSHTVPPQCACHPFNTVTLQHACHPTLCLCSSVHVIPQCVSSACMSSCSVSQNCMSSNAVPSQRPSMQSWMCLYSSACNPRLCFYSVHVLPYCVSTVLGCPRKWHFGIPRNTEVISSAIPAKFRGIPRNFAEFRRNWAEITSEVKKFRGIPCRRNSVDTLPRARYPNVSQQWACHTAYLLCLDSVHVIYSVFQVCFIPYYYYVLKRMHVIRHHGCISIAVLSANAVSRCVVPGDQCYVSKMCCAMHDRQSLYL
jgi:hypothetical protein